MSFTLFPHRGRERSAGRLRRRPLPVQRRGRWDRLLTTPGVWLLALLAGGSLLLVARAGLFAPRLVPGGVAPRDIVAPRELLVADEAATEVQREQARARVLPVYDYDPRVAADVDARLTTLFDQGRRLLGGEPAAAPSPSTPSPPAAAPRAAGLEELRQMLLERSGVDVELARLQVLQRQRFSTVLEERCRSLVAALLRVGVVEAKDDLLANRLNGIVLRNLQSGAERRSFDLYDYWGRPDEVLEYLDTELRRPGGLAARERTALVELLGALTPPNVYQNRSETAARREAAAEQAELVVRRIRPGQIVVRRGDVLDLAAWGAVRELGLDRGAGGRLTRPWLGGAALLLLFGLLLRLAVRQEHDPASELGRRTFGGLVVMALGWLATVQLGALVSGGLSQAIDALPFDASWATVYAIPFAGFALLCSLVYGRSLALVAGVGFSVLAGRAVSPDSFGVTFYALAGTFAAVYSLDRVKERSAVARAGLMIGLVNVAAGAVLAASGELPPAAGLALLLRAACGLVGGLLAAALSSFGVPALEWLSGTTTDLRLIELSDTNRPLLRRLAFEAPGTFQHSLVVANLARVGCESIDANSALAYTGGLYHDIGKMLRPQYFIENQSGENLHDKLSPSMSSLIVIAHVRDGLDLALRERLPLPLLDAVRQHHGTRKLAYFYRRAQEQDGEGRGVSEHDYRYPGPKPQDKVMGVLMLADGIEAASRVLRDPTPARIRDLVEEVVSECIRDGQLEETDLTFEDLHAVKAAFCRMLESVHHRRVEYPGFDFNRRGRRWRVVHGAQQGSPPAAAPAAGEETGAE